MKSTINHIFKKLQAKAKEKKKNIWSEALEAENIRCFPNVLETSKTKQDYSYQYFALLESIGKEIEQLEKEARRSL